ncbi:hypothetical protein AB2L28_16655 [Kineococcus sp. TBRC 1896]|uniref:Asp23/Gls24 family envelope stress response protein n=1 Tax=Kineococcus mangrovi TaxID=1660183 RepID=A0ABV4I8B4_9ACTN
MTTTPQHSHGEQVLARATGSLRLHTPAGWRVSRADLLETVRRAHRPAAPVRGRHALGEFVVSCDVLTTGVRGAVDRLPRADVTTVRCVTDAEDHLDLLTVETGVRYGAHVPTTAEEVRTAVVAAVRDLLGEVDGLRVHVHVGDVFE